MTVYKHIRNDTNDVFYIGIGGSERRAYSKRSRNQYWKNIVKSHGYTVKIVAIGLTYNEACSLERSLIKTHGRKDLGQGLLANMTDGGDGLINSSKETKAKISKSLTGKKQSKATRLKRSKTLKETWKNEELRELKRTQTIELFKNGVLKSRKGVPSPIKGRPFQGDREKLSISLKKYYMTNEPHNKITLPESTVNELIYKYKNGSNVFRLSKEHNLNRKVINRIFKEKGVL